METLLTIFPSVPANLLESCLKLAKDNIQKGEDPAADPIPLAVDLVFASTDENTSEAVEVLDLTADEPVAAPNQNAPVPPFLISDGPIVLDDAPTPPIAAPSRSQPPQPPPDNPQFLAAPSRSEPPKPLETLQFLSETFPDCDPDWLEFHLKKGKTVQEVTDIIVDLDGKYPKRQSGGKKRKYDEATGSEVVEEAPKKVLKRDYTILDGVGRSANYYTLCLDYLFFEAYPNLPQYQLRSWFNQNGRQLVPTCMVIENLLKTPESLPCKIKKSISKAKNKQRAVHCQEFDQELEAWRAMKSKTELKCLDSNGCKFSFPRSEIVRFLPPKVLEGYDRLCQEEDLRKAGLSDLAKCPFCDYAAIMATDPAVDKLFHCQNKASKDDVIDARHLVEEAMTQALLRECPGCKAKFFKTEGCNKMQCPQCRKLMCYICKAQINGYDHFANDPQGKVQKGKTCPLWDDSVKRNEEEVARAAKIAAANISAENPDFKVEDLTVKLPPTPPRPPPPAAYPVAHLPPGRPAPYNQFPGRPAHYQQPAYRPAANFNYPYHPLPARPVAQLPVARPAPRRQPPVRPAPYQPPARPAPYQPRPPVRPAQAYARPQYMAPNLENLIQAQAAVARPVSMPVRPALPKVAAQKRGRNK
ncbi:hypothetical protein HDV05_008611 [Chytridiales sp. JEL 0842]|nr:hypothetical protein HDV05_008611 [Chytridiales sp. JEL 0842]